MKKKKKKKIPFPGVFLLLEILPILSNEIVHCNWLELKLEQKNFGIFIHFFFFFLLPNHES